MVNIDDGKEVEALHPLERVVRIGRLQRERVAERERDVDVVLMVRHVVHGQTRIVVTVLLGELPIVERCRRIVGTHTAVEAEPGSLAAVVAGERRENGHRVPQHVGVRVLVGTAQTVIDDSGAVVRIAIGQIDDHILRDTRRLRCPLERIFRNPLLHQRKLGS